jgi:ornithine carbamoyltransferase
MTVRHFLTLMDLSSSELLRLLKRAIQLKKMQKAGEPYAPLRDKTLAMIFDKSSTRTRVSFEAAMTQFGGNAIFLTAHDTQLGRGEPAEDTARVMSRMVDAITIRTFQHGTLETFAANSAVPVINALTDMYHPCQLLADLQTFMELRGEIAGRTVAWVGDGNNMCHSWMNAARQCDFTLRIATPEGYAPNQDLLTACASHVQTVDSPRAAAQAADIVVTDTWASMGQEDEKAQRMAAFDGYIVDARLMSLASKDAVFMHCLPAYRGFEVSAEVIDGAQSVVWEQAENRLHAQKALLEFLLADRPD